MPKVTKQTPRKKKTSKRKPQRQSVSTESTAWPDDDFGLKVHLYGKSGTGKTTFWATFPDPILAIVCSGGNKPGELRSIKTPKNMERIKPVVLQSTKHLEELLDLASAYHTVVLDHVSGFQDLVIAEILGLPEAPVSMYRAAGKGESWSVLTMKQFGEVSTIMKEFLRSFLSLESNVVLVLQEREFNLEVEGDMITPYVAGDTIPSVGRWLRPACDYIVQTFLRPKTQETTKRVGRKEVRTKKRTGEIEYCLRCAPHEVYTVKFRRPVGSGDLPEAIVDPTYGKVNQIIQGG